MIELNKDTYSKEEVREMLTQFQTKMSDLEKQVTDLETVKQQYAELEKNSIATQIKLEATKAGLNPEEIFDLVESDDIQKAQAKINKLVELKKKQDIDNSYKPNDHKQDDSYSIAEKDKNVEGMIFSKLNKIFS